MATEEHKARRREYMREWYRKHPGANAANVKQWREKNPDCRAKEYARTGSDYARAYRAKMSPGELSVYYLKADLWKKHRLKIEDYVDMMLSQGYKCAICKTEPRQKHRLHVDHNHETGKNRGLLCSTCNTALYKVEADPTWGAKALTYLASHQEAQNASN